MSSVSGNDSVLESQIVHNIVKRLRTEQRCVVRKRHGTAFGVRGDADLFGSLGGRHFEIEVKRPGKVPTELQAARLAEWRASGAMAGSATNVAEALAILGLGQ